MYFESGNVEAMVQANQIHAFRNSIPVYLLISCSGIKVYCVSWEVGRDLDFQTEEFYFLGLGHLSITLCV